MPLSVPLSDGKSYERSEREEQNQIKRNPVTHDNGTNEGALHITLLKRTRFLLCCDSSHIKGCGSFFFFLKSQRGTNMQLQCEGKNLCLLPEATTV